MATGESPRIDRLYDSLSRYQWWLRRVRRAQPGGGLEMHKRLRSGARGRPAAGCAGINDWLWEQLDPALRDRPLRVLDVGCGFGATLHAFARRAKPESRFVGLTVSPYQAKKATAEARRAGLDARCAFRVQSFDDEVGEEFDLIVSIESLFHAPDLGHTLARLRACAAPGATLALVEDMARDEAATEDPAARRLLSCWATASMATVTDFRSGLAAAGFELRQDLDLTAQVDLPLPHRLDRERRLRRWRRFAPAGRRVVDAFLGGLAMEELYERDLLEYRAMIATRAEEA